MAGDVDSLYGRDALVLYLQDVRDLEVMRALFTRKIAEGDKELEAARRQYLTPAKVKVPQQSSASKAATYIASGYLWYLLAATVFMTLYSVAMAFSGGSLKDVFTVIPLVAIDMLLYNALQKRKNKRTDARDEALRHNAADDERLRQNRAMFTARFEQPWQQKRSFLLGALQKVQDALEQVYALNIIPLQYRKLEAALYLYDFMSTSQQPFAQALDHAQIDEGIRRIVAALNVIIAQNEQQLKQLAQINASTQTLIRQGEAILMAQVATAQYASSAAAHARAVETKIDNMNDYLRYGF